MKRKKQAKRINFLNIFVGIPLTAYTPLGSPGRPSQIKSNDEPHLLSDEILKTIASKHSASAGQVISNTLFLLTMTLLLFRTV